MNDLPIQKVYELFWNWTNNYDQNQLYLLGDLEYANSYDNIDLLEWWYI